MPKAKNYKGIDFESIARARRENPDNYFSMEESERRMIETVRRVGGRPATFDLKTGQNFGEPKLSEEELKRRGYPCAAFWNGS